MSRHQDVATDWNTLTHLLIVRYLGMGLPLLLAIAIMRSVEPRSQLLVEACAAALVAIPCAALVGTVYLARKNVEPW